MGAIGNLILASGIYTMGLILINEVSNGKCCMYNKHPYL